MLLFKAPHGALYRKCGYGRQRGSHVPVYYGLRRFLRAAFGYDLPSAAYARVGSPIWRSDVGQVQSKQRCSLHPNGTWVGAGKRCVLAKSHQYGCLKAKHDNNVSGMTLLQPNEDNCLVPFSVVFFLWRTFDLRWCAAAYARRIRQARSWARLRVRLSIQPVN